ncbi:uncharacterized protein METZ01_LOCUS115867 [marine metagenome]|uniref:Uncharacterized protein n=1 Tax=marine metagenome TaxID=408172 RepID=A0A381XFG6_9ZZZZ
MIDFRWKIAKQTGSQTSTTFVNYLTDSWC